MSKTIKELNRDDDFLFAKVMSDPDICKKVLEKILTITIKKITMPTEQKVIDLVLHSKSVRLDIYVHDDTDTIYNIEMQKTKHKNLAKRSRYYQGNIDLDFIQKGEKYDKLYKSFVIFICTFDPFNQGRHIYTFENRCLDDTNLSVGDETTKLFLNTRGNLIDVDDEMIEFLTYIEHSNDEYANQTNSPLVKTINQKVQYLKHDTSLEVEYMTLYERDQEKLEEGELKKSIEIAKKLIIRGLNDEFIIETTELNLELIQSLRSELINS